MAFFPHVNPGDPVKPSTLLENNIRDVVNRFNATGELPVSRGAANSCRLQCWNNNDYTIPAGASVEIAAETAWSEDCPPVQRASLNAAAFGIAVTSIEPGCIGPVLFAGVIILDIQTNSSCKYISPDGDGGFVDSDCGAVVLSNSGGKLVVLLGGGASGGNYNSCPYALSYDPIARIVTVNPGYINCNGVFGVVGSCTLAPQTGIVCVHCELASDGSGRWNTPDIVYAEPNKNNYPIGAVIVTDNGSVSVYSWPVTVATIIDTAECPYSVAYYE